jgi:hypothetical protein
VLVLVLGLGFPRGMQGSLKRVRLERVVIGQLRGS